MAVETSAAEGWVRPGVFFGESAAGEGRRAFAGGACTTRCCSEESSVLKRLPEPLLFRIQYRMARVALSKTLLRSLLHSMLCFF